MVRQRFPGPSQALRSRRHLGQNFLTESWPCEKIRELLTRHRVRHVLEIGPGQGALTHHLIAAGIQVTGVEKDPRCVEILRDRLGSDSRYEMITGDILAFDLARWIGPREGQGGVAVCGNIPYNISSPIVQWLLPSLGMLRGAVLMVQLEFGERLAAQPGSKNYGSLSVYTQLQAQARLEFKVERSAFYPVPGVDSSVVSLTPRAPGLDPLLLGKVERLSKHLFSGRRKQLANSLGSLREEIAWDGLNLDLTRRCETLHPEEFLDLARRWTPRGGDRHAEAKR